MSVPLTSSRYQCSSCRRQFAVRWPRDEAAHTVSLSCPDCGAAVVAVTDDSDGLIARVEPDDGNVSDWQFTVETFRQGAGAAAEHWRSARSRWQRFKDSYLTLRWPEGRQGLRRCRACGAFQFTGPRPCCSCSGATVGLDAAAALDGFDEHLGRQYARFDRARGRVRRVRRSLIVAWLVIAAVQVLLRGPVAGALASALLAVPLLALYGAYVFLEDRRFSALRRQVEHRQAEAPQRAAGLTGLVDETLLPFLDRNNVLPYDRVAVPQSELAMLREMLAGRGLPIASETLDRLLSCAALERDRRVFSERLGCVEGQGNDPVACFAALYTAEQDDAIHLPFLLELVRRRDGGRFSAREVRRRQAECRRAESLRGFEQDLAGRRGKASGGRGLTLGEIDCMDPYNFELLLGLIYRAQGYRVEKTPKSGDQGADVIIEKAGQRTVVQAKLYTGAVGNSAVQEVAAARAHFGCHVAAVVTNASFTRAAVDLATTNRVQLVDRSGLQAMLEAFNRSPRDQAALRELLVPREPSGEDAVGQFVAPPD